MYFAKIDIFNKVLKVIVADQDFIDTLPGQWVPTDIDGVSPKNYAGIDYTFDIARMAFIPPKPYQSWVLNESNCQWEAPNPMPQDGQMYQWDETSLSWIVRS
jgi:hypothetical protein